MEELDSTIFRQLCESLVTSNSSDFFMGSDEEFSAWSKGFAQGQSNLASIILEKLNGKETDVRRASGNQPPTS